MDVSHIKAVIFDCDGVMFDTSKANKKFYDTVLALFKKPEISNEQFENIHKMSVIQAIQYLFLKPEDQKIAFEYIKNIGYDQFIEYMVMEKGLIRLLKALNNHNIIRGIGTNRTNTMEKVLKVFELENYFEIVVTASDVQYAKPHPDQLLLIMSKFDLMPDQVFFIGDSDYDQKAAQGAKTWFAAFKNSDLKADFQVNSMDEVSEILKVN